MVNISTSKLTNIVWRSFYADDGNWQQNQQLIGNDTYGEYQKVPFCLTTWGFGDIECATKKRLLGALCEE